MLGFQSERNENAFQCQREWVIFCGDIWTLESDWQVWSPGLVESHQLCLYELINLNKFLPLWPQFFHLKNRRMEQMIPKFLSLSEKLVILKERQLIFGLELGALRRQCEILTGFMAGVKTKQIQALVEICPCAHPSMYSLPIYPWTYPPISLPLPCCHCCCCFICLSLIFKT